MEQHLSLSLPFLGRTALITSSGRGIGRSTALYFAQRVVPYMKPCSSGCIVSITGPGSFRVMTDYIIVGASKASLESLTRYLIMELAPKNIVVNAVSSGIMHALEHFDVMSDSKVIERTVAQTLSGRLVTPEDVAQVVTFLCMLAAHMIRGPVILGDGGYMLPAS